MRASGSWPATARVLAGTLAILMLIAACGATAVVEPDDQAAAGSTTPAAAATPQPPEPTAPPVERPTPEPTPERLEEPTAVARADALLGISRDGRFAYAGTLSPWSDDVPCDGEPAESLAAIDVEASLRAGGEPIAFAAGLTQTGAIRQIVFSQEGRLAIVSSCGPVDENETVWVQTAELDGTGRLSSVGEPLPLERGPDGFAPFLRRWEGEDLIQTELYVQTDPTDFDSAVLERRLISVETGEVVSTEEIPAATNGEERRGSYTSPDGRFTYTDIPDPGGALGCEGIGVARTFEVDDGTGPRSALGDDGVVFSYLVDVEFGVDDLVMWTSGCEGYTTAYVGRIADDGIIADAHWIDTYALTVDEADGEFVEFHNYRLDDQGRLLGLGTAYDDDGEGNVRLFRYDLATDPSFITSADVELGIDETSPLAPTLTGPGSWFVGNTLSSEPACGGKTLYGETSTGFARALPGGTELDAVVDLDVSEARTQVFDGGEGSYTGRTIVVSTECEGEYEGRRIWFGEESGRVRDGLFLSQADLGDLGEVAEVLSVRESLDPDVGYPEALFAEVVLLDGTVTEVELIAVPFEN